jgi:hypothetical protein
VGWDTNKIISFLEIILHETNSNITNGVAAARDAAENFLRDGTGYGLPALAEFFSEAVAARLARFLEYRESNNEDSLEKLNNQFCVLSMGGKARVLEFQTFSERKTTVFYSFNDFKGLMDNQKIKTFSRDKDGNEVSKTSGLGSWWLNNAQRRQYKGLAFKPGQEKILDGYLNLWQGWGIEPAAGTWTLLRAHIKTVLASGIEEFDNYIIKWAAWALQNPGEPAGVVLVLRGSRGAGKGLFAREMEKAFGQHGMHISSAGHLAGRFNAHLMDCALLFADEAFWPGDKSSEGTLKRIITEDTLLIERKGVDAFQVDNNLHIIMASNTDWVVPAGIGERRFAVFDVAEEQAQKSKYFEPLYSEIKAGGTAAMMHDLLAMELDGWHPRMDIPRNAALLDQQMQTLSAPEQWWLDLLQDGHLPGAEEADPRLAPSFELFEHARATVPGLRYTSDHLLGRILQRHGADRNKNYRIGGRRAWRFPPLTEARAAWENKIKARWTWPAADQEEWSAPTI